MNTEPTLEEAFSPPQNTETKEQIIVDIKFYVMQQGGRYPDWYVGISKNPKQRLYGVHKLQKDKDVWIYRRASTPLEARQAEDHLMLTLGFDGGIAPDDESADIIYAFKKSRHSSPKGEEESTD